jgi:hypothetical protein
MTQYRPYSPRSLSKYWHNTHLLILFKLLSTYWYNTDLLILLSLCLHIDTTNSLFSSAPVYILTQHTASFSPQSLLHTDTTHSCLLSSDPLHTDTTHSFVLSSVSCFQRSSAFVLLMLSFLNCCACTSWRCQICHIFFTFTAKFK